MKKAQATACTWRSASEHSWGGGMSSQRAARSSRNPREPEREQGEGRREGRRREEEEEEGEEEGGREERSRRRESRRRGTRAQRDNRGRLERTRSLSTHRGEHPQERWDELDVGREREDRLPSKMN